MALSLSLGCRNGLANEQGLSEMFNGGTLRILTGFSPGVEAGVTGTELFSAAIVATSAGLGRLHMDVSGTIGNSGAAGYFRVSHADDVAQINSAGTALRFDGTCGVLEDTGDLLFTGLDMTAGKTLTVHGDVSIET